MSIAAAAATGAVCRLDSVGEALVFPSGRWGIGLMWKRRGLVGLASLLFCLWGAADAQSPGAGSNTPPQLRVGDLPPEVRAQLPADLSPDTLLVGPPNSDGDAVYADPSVLQALELPPSIAAEVDAVVAAESMQLLPVHFRLAGPFAAGAPFEARFPPGTDIKQLVEEGEIRNCIRQHGTYTPPEDENGEIYPGICLEDRDGDGAYETALFLPYLDQFPPRTIAIEPVRLEPNPAAMTADREAFSVQRRIRVAALESGVVRLVLEHGLAPTYRPDRGRFDSGPDDSVILPLRQDVAVELGGIIVRAERDGATWRLVPSGRFPSWLQVHDHGRRIIAGSLEYHLPPSPY